jgi:hypothetical protein
MSAFGAAVVNLRRIAGGFDAEHASGEQLRPMFLSPEARATAEYLRELMAFSPPGILGMAWYDRAIAYAHGRAAMAYSHSMLAPLYEVDPTSPAHRRTGYLPHPVGPGGRPIVPMGGYALSIPANIAPERIRPAWTALRTLTSASAAKLYLMNGSLASPRLSVSRDPEVRSISPLIATIDEMAASGMLRMWPRPPVPGVTALIDIAGQEIHDALAGAKPIAQALIDAQNRADAVMRSCGAYSATTRRPGGATTPENIQNGHLTAFFRGDQPRKVQITGCRRLAAKTHAMQLPGASIIARHACACHRSREGRYQSWQCKPFFFPATSASSFARWQYRAPAPAKCWFRSRRPASAAVTSVFITATR